MDKERYQPEYTVLSQRVPENAFRFFNTEGKSKRNPYLRIAVFTKSGNLYNLHMDLSSFPATIPPVFVMKMLKDKDGNDLSGTSACMHTLSSEHGWTRICHYGYNDWTPAVSLFKVYIRCHLWLEMYEAHLQTGKPIDYYLKHA